MRVLTGVLWLVVGGCGGGSSVAPDGVPPPAAGAADASPATETAVVELRLDQAETVGGLRLLWVGLADSRCPRGVECVWEGEVKTTLEIVLADGAAATVGLSLRPGADQDPTAVPGHELRLLEVRPHPIEGVSPARSDYRAKVDVRALTE